MAAGNVFSFSEISHPGKWAAFTDRNSEILEQFRIEPDSSHYVFESADVLAQPNSSH